MNYGLFSNMSFILFAFILTTIELIFCFIRKNKLNVLSKIFLCLVILSILSLSSEILSLFLMNNIGVSLFNVNISVKIFTFIQLLLVFIFILYFGYLFLVDLKDINKKDNLKYIYIFLVLSIFLSIIITCFIPFSFIYYDDLNTYSFNINYYKIFRLIGIFISLYSGILLFFCMKKIKDINLISVYFTFVLYIIFTLYSLNNTVIFDFTTPFYAIITFLLFLSIENQDYLSLDDYVNINDTYNKINNSKKYFSSNLSHFYRSRFSTILGLLSVNDSEKANITSNDLNRIEEANNYLLNVSSSVVDILKIDNYSYKTEVDKYKVITLINKLKSIRQDFDIQLHTSSNLDNMECYGYKEIIYKMLYYLLLSSTYKSNNKSIDIYVSVNNSIITYTISYYNEHINNDIFNQSIDDYLNGLSLSLEDYNTYLIASKYLAKYINSDILFENNKDNMCLFKVSIPIIVTENTINERGI